MFQPGDTIKNYRLVKKLGDGASGQVWRATDGERRCAIKFMNTHLLESTSAGKHRERFMREIMALQKLKDHPNIPNLYDYDIDHEPPYIVMQFIGSPSYKELLRGGELLRQPVQRRVDIVHELAMALYTAHSIDIVHRDIKPANIAGLDNPYLLDFSIAISQDQLQHSSVQVGTYPYMPWDSIKDKLGDIYSFGLVVYEIFFGKHALIDPDDPELRKSFMMGPLKAGQAYRDGTWRIPSKVASTELPAYFLSKDLTPLDAVFMKVLGPREERYSDPRDFANDLDRAIQDVMNRTYMEMPSVPQPEPEEPSQQALYGETQLDIQAIPPPAQATPPPSKRPTPQQPQRSAPVYDDLKTRYQQPVATPPAQAVPVPAPAPAPVPEPRTHPGRLLLFVILAAFLISLGGIAIAGILIVGGLIPAPGFLDGVLVAEAATATPTLVATTAAPAELVVVPSATSIPATDMDIPATDTSQPPTATQTIVEIVATEQENTAIPATIAPSMTATTLPPTATQTIQATTTPRPTETDTATLEPSETATRIAPNTEVAVVAQAERPTETSTAAVTATDEPTATNTALPPTATDEPTVTNTALPSTATDEPTATNTATPLPPTATATLEASATLVPATATAIPSATMQAATAVAAVAEVEQEAVTLTGEELAEAVVALTSELQQIGTYDAYPCADFTQVYAGLVAHLPDDGPLVRDWGNVIDAMTPLEAHCNNITEAGPLPTLSLREQNLSLIVRYLLPFTEQLETTD